MGPHHIEIVYCNIIPSEDWLNLYIKKGKTAYLNSDFGQIDLQSQRFPGVNVRIVGFFEGSL